MTTQKTKIEIVQIIERIKLIKKNTGTIPFKVWNYVVYSEKKYRHGTEVRDVTGHAQNLANKLTKETGFKISYEIVGADIFMVVCKNNF